MIFNLPDPSQVYFGANIPEQHEDIFEDIIERAVNLLDLEPNETVVLNNKQRDLEEMILSVCPYLFYTDDEQISEEEAQESRSYARILYENINLIELASDDMFSWSQYFALLALAEINQLVFMLFFKDQIPEDLLKYIENSHIVCIKHSVEAVCYGETLSHKMPTQGIIKEKISKQAQKAISIRYKPLNEIKKSFIEFYFDSNNKSNKSEIARKFYRALDEEQKRVLTSTLKEENASRTLINHLNKFLNSDEPFNL